MIMRVACGIHYGNVERAIETYELMSLKLFTHATPTLFNAGTPRPQMSSCKQSTRLSVGASCASLHILLRFSVS